MFGGLIPRARKYINSTLIMFKNKNVVYAASSLHLVTNKYPLGLLARVVDAS